MAKKPKQEKPQSVTSSAPKKVGWLETAKDMLTGQTQESKQLMAMNQEQFDQWLKEQKAKRERMKR